MPAHYKRRFHWEYGQYLAILHHPKLDQPVEITKNCAGLEHMRVKAKNTFVTMFGFLPVVTEVFQLAGEPTGRFT